MNQILKRPFLLLTFIVGLILVAPTYSTAAVEYEVSRYEVTVELVPDKDGELRDTAVTMLVTYNIQSGLKSDGFKFVGTLPLQNVSVTDGEGRPLRHQIENLKENKIIWYFNEPRNQGEQTIIAHFILVGALNGNLEGNSLSFDWIKNWKVPVRNATYRFLLPSDYQFEELSIKPASYSGNQPEITIWGDKRCIETRWEQLPDSGLEISFAPGIVKAPFTFPKIPAWIYWVTGIGAFIAFSRWYEKRTGRPLIYWHQVIDFMSSGGGDGGCGGGCGDDGGCGSGCGDGCGGGCGE